MITKNKMVLSIFISILPCNCLRVSDYRLVFGYKIHASRISFGTIVNVAQFNISSSHIGKYNKFIGSMKVVIENNTKIGSHNIFQCSDWIMQSKKLNDEYKRTLEIGENTLITGDHYFNISGKFVLGKNSWIAG